MANICISCEIKKVGNGYVGRFVYQSGIEEMVFVGLKEMTDYLTQVFSKK